MILIQQLGELVEDTHDDMTNGQSGSADTLFLKTQTGLINPITATETALTDKTFTQSNVSVSHVIDTSTANTADIIEHEVNNGGDSYNRSVKATISKNDQLEVTTVYTFDFELVS